VEPALPQQARGLERAPLLPQDHREDGRDHSLHGEAQRLESGLHPPGERVEARAALRLRREDVEGGDGRGAAGGGKRGGEDEGPGPADEPVHQLGRAGHEGAEAPQRLAERAHEHVDLDRQAERLGQAGAGRAEDAGGVGLVEVEHGAVPLAEIDDLPERRRVAVHAEDGVGGDEPAAGTGRREQPGEPVHVAVAVDLDVGAGEAAAVDDGGVVPLVGEDRVARADERPHHACVHVVARREEEGRRGPLHARQARLQLVMQVHVADDEPRRPRSGAESGRRLDGGVPEPRIAGEPEVVVGAEVHERAAGDLHHRPLGAGDGLEPAAQPLRLQGAELRGDPVEQASGRPAASGAPAR
jgi:hypothetical protein